MPWPSTSRSRSAKASVSGGTGQIGPAVVTELVGSGHTVTALARSDAAAARLQALGATPLPGDMEDLETLTAGASQADGVVHMANGGDFADPFMARVYGTDAPASSEHTRQLLGWTPDHRTLLDDLAHGDCCDAPA